MEESELSIYTDGAAVYDDMIDAINSARHSVLMEAFIWKNDEVGQRFVDTFNAAAGRGVDTYLIYDGFANMLVPRSFYRQLSEQIHVYRLPVVGRKFWKGPLRYTGVNHSKILVVDDAIGFVGGYNIGSLYARQWRDTHLRGIGPGLWGLRQSITRLWNEAHEPGEQIPWIPPHSWKPELNVAANLPIQLVYPIRHMYLMAFEKARDRIWLTTPYFIPDQQILEALVAAAERGVDVRVMVPRDSNHVLGDWVSRGFFGELLEAGVSILRYTSSMMHAKTATVDGQWSTVGTANIDRLSLTFNYETNVEIIDPKFAAELEKVFRSDAEHCEQLSSAWHDRHPMVRVAEAALVPLRPWL
ncbi:phospholipase D-like domain-containing protein [Arthrobacter castelli]|uniref:phospholipase D-like domain-containing protein n=1 Tax=Arthrobacter castelli TaxID=271431 RepID=UPI000420825C